MKKSAFSTVELVVAMGVMVALISLTVFSVNIAQRSSRDSSRKSTLADVALAINNYRRTNLNYPSTVQFQTNSVAIGGQTVTELSGHLRSGTQTTSGSTSYFYEVSADGEFALCVTLESGGIESLGTLDCSLTSFGGGPGLN